MNDKDGWKFDLFILILAVIAFIVSCNVLVELADLFGNDF